MTAIFLIVIAYLLGGVPTAYLMGRRRGADVRKLGTRNVGAANAASLFGLRVGVVVLFVDVVKGGVVMLVAQALNLSSWGALLVALAVIAGHNWSPYLRGAGGRGLAPAIGISLAVVPLLSVIGLGIGLAWYLATRRLLQAGVAAFVSTNALVVLTGQPVATLVMCGLISALVFGTHFLKNRVHKRHGLVASGSLS